MISRVIYWPSHEHDMSLWFPREEERQDADTAIDIATMSWWFIPTDNIFEDSYCDKYYSCPNLEVMRCLQCKPVVHAEALFWVKALQELLEGTLHEGHEL